MKNTIGHRNVQEILGAVGSGDFDLDLVAHIKSERERADIAEEKLLNLKETIVWLRERIINDWTLEEGEGDLVDYILYNLETRLENNYIS